MCGFWDGSFFTSFKPILWILIFMIIVSLLELPDWISRKLRGEKKNDLKDKVQELEKRIQELEEKLKDQE